MPPVCIIATGVLAAKSPKFLLRILPRRSTPVLLLTSAFRHNEVKPQKAALQHADDLDQVAGIVKLPSLSSTRPLAHSMAGSHFGEQAFPTCRVACALMISWAPHVMSRGKSFFSYAFPVRGRAILYQVEKDDTRTQVIAGLH